MSRFDNRMLPDYSNDPHATTDSLKKVRASGVYTRLCHHYEMEG